MVQLVMPNIKVPPMVVYALVTAGVALLSSLNHNLTLKGIPRHFGEFPKVDAALSNNWGQQLLSAGITDIKCDSSYDCAFSTVDGQLSKFRINEALPSQTDLVKGLELRTTGASDFSVAAQWDPDRVPYEAAYSTAVHAIQTAIESRGANRIARH